MGNRVALAFNAGKNKAVLTAEELSQEARAREHDAQQLHLEQEGRKKGGAPRELKGQEAHQADADFE